MCKYVSLRYFYDSSENLKNTCTKFGADFGQKHSSDLGPLILYNSCMNIKVHQYFFKF